MDIMPRAWPPSQPPTPDTYADRMSRADGCPDCCDNVETPYRIQDEGHSFTAYYGCEDCGWFWQTAWTD